MKSLKSFEEDTPKYFRTILTNDILKVCVGKTRSEIITALEDIEAFMADKDVCPPPRQDDNKTKDLNVTQL